ncbi:hypothetical protein M0813_05006 [Anaeramoeba flamelloides]|uniref:Uncharacterized protein n=1 Tax=Anaeramoeba flamelloides TaxID=1746091 RepID=A0ABQ8XIK4_9EUKA|nr:hypothetical protein M0813_05006 [Anaeramoeba flamelloides]
MNLKREIETHTTCEQDLIAIKENNFKQTRPNFEIFKKEILKLIEQNQQLTNESKQMRQKIDLCSNQLREEQTEKHKIQEEYHHELKLLTDQIEELESKVLQNKEQKKINQQIRNEKKEKETKKIIKKNQILIELRTKNHRLEDLLTKAQTKNEESEIAYQELDQKILKLAEAVQQLEEHINQLNKIKNINNKNFQKIKQTHLQFIKSIDLYEQEILKKKENDKLITDQIINLQFQLNEKQKENKQFKLKESQSNTRIETMEIQTRELLEKNQKLTIENLSLFEEKTKLIQIIKNYIKKCK